MALSKDVVIRLLGDADSANRAIQSAAREAEVSVAVYKRAEREYLNQQRALESSARQHRENMAQVARGITTVMGATVAAATAAGLAVPAALVGVSAAFAGIGIAAAAQNDEVREAFAGLRDVVKDSVDEIGAPMEDSLIRVAGETAAAFQRMKPQIIDGVTAAVPAVEKLTDATLSMAENALPGLVTAAENAGPAVDGLGRFLETVGTGMGQFFADLSDHAPAAGAAFDGLGQVIEELLPLLSTLIGEGSELAADALPAIADALPLVHSALSLVLDAAQMLGPALPALVAGFVGLKAASAGLSMIGGVGDNLQLLGHKMGMIDGNTRRFSASLGAVGAAVPIVGALVGVAVSEWDAHGNALAANSEKFSTLIAAMRQGGAASEEAAGKLAGLNDIMDKGGMIATLLSDAHGVAAEAERARVEALTPLEEAQERMTAAERTLAEVMGDNTSTTQEVAAAQGEYEKASREVADAQAAAELAIHGVTQAMVDQALQALAAADSQIAYEQSVNRTEDAQTAYNDAVRDHGAVSEEAERASLGLREALLNQASAAATAEADALGLTDELERNNFTSQRTLEQLLAMREQMGSAFPAALNQTIARLQQSTDAMAASEAGAAELRDQVSGLATNIREVPGVRAVQIDVPTAEQRRRIEELGNKIVTLPDGSVYVVADTADAARQIAMLTVRRTVQIVATTIGNWGGPARAEGGPVWPGETFLVGERGPELVQFGGQGFVTPAAMTAQAMAAAGRSTAPTGPGIPVGSHGVGAGSAAAVGQLQASVAQLSAAVAGIRGGTTVQVGEWNNAGQTPHETAEALAWLARR